MYEEAGHTWKTSFCCESKNVLKNHLFPKNSNGNVYISHCESSSCESTPERWSPHSVPGLSISLD